MQYVRITEVTFNQGEKEHVVHYWFITPVMTIAAAFSITDYNPNTRLNYRSTAQHSSFHELFAISSKDSVQTMKCCHEYINGIHKILKQALYL